MFARIEDEDLQVLAIAHLDRTDRECIFGGEKFVLAPATAADLIEDAATHETVENLA